MNYFPKKARYDVNGMGGSDGIGGGAAAAAGPYAMDGTGTTRSPRIELDSIPPEYYYTRYGW